MKFVLGFVTAVLLLALAAALVFVTGAYNVAATVPHTDFGRTILNAAMVRSVRARAGWDLAKTWTKDQVQDGFQEYNEMCVYCHAAPGKEASDFGKGLRPAPPDLIEAQRRWNNAELFWIVRNGIKMTGMAAFGPTHDDETIWNIVGFIRHLPRLSPEDYESMEQKSAGSPEEHHHH